jgi:hypothetical protein
MARILIQNLDEILVAQSLEDLKDNELDIVGGSDHYWDDKGKDDDDDKYGYGKGHGKGHGYGHGKGHGYGHGREHGKKDDYYYYPPYPYFPCYPW